MPSLPPAEIAFPSVVVNQGMPHGGINLNHINWFTPRDMSGWPLVWDMDEPERFIAWRKRIQ